MAPKKLREQAFVLYDIIKLLKQGVTLQLHPFGRPCTAVEERR